MSRCASAIFMGVVRCWNSDGIKKKGWNKNNKMFIDFPKKTNKKTTVKFGIHPIPVASFFHHPLPQLRTSAPDQGRLVAMLSRLHLDTCSQRCNLQVLGLWQERDGMGWAAASQKKLSVFDRENLRKQFFGVVFGSDSEMFGKVRKRASWGLLANDGQQCRS